MVFRVMGDRGDEGGVGEGGGEQGASRGNSSD